MISTNRLLPVLWLLGLGGCNSSADQPATAPPPADRTTAPSAGPAPAPPADTVAAAGPGQPVSLAGQTFRLRAFPLGPGRPDTPPQFRIYLYPSQRPDSVLVAEDTEPSVLDPDQGRRMGVPKTAVILFQTYNAGAGYHYYAATEGHQLRIYRKRLEEATPANEHGARPAWQLYRTFGFFTDGARQL